MSADDTPSIKPDRSKDAADFKLEPHDMSWFERPGTVKPLVFALYAACVIFLLLDALILRHGKIAIENLFGFYAVAGFLSCAAIAAVSFVASKILRQSEEGSND